MSYGHWSIKMIWPGIWGTSIKRDSSSSKTIRRDKLKDNRNKLKELLLEICFSYTFLWKCLSFDWQKNSEWVEVSALNNSNSIKHYLLFLSTRSLFKYSIFITHLSYCLIFKAIFTCIVDYNFNHFIAKFSHNNYANLSTNWIS